MVDLRYSSTQNLYKINFINQETEEQRLLKRLAQGDRHAFLENMGIPSKLSLPSLSGLDGRKS